MLFTFLGTSSGVPSKTRNVSGLAIRCQDRKSWCLVDCGEATQHQLLKTSYSLAKLDAVFITHVHGDHCYGLPGLLASTAMAGRSKPLTLVAPAPIRDFLDATIRATDLHLGYELEFIDVSQLNDSLDCAGMSVFPVELSHRVPCHGYNFTMTRRNTQLDTDRLQRDKIAPGPVWGRLQKGEDVTLADGVILKSADYVHSCEQQRSILDCGDNDSPQCLASLTPDVIVHEATYDEAVVVKSGASYGHSSAGQIAAYAQSKKIKNLVLTHFSPRYHGDGNAIKYSCP